MMKITVLACGLMMVALALAAQNQPANDTSEAATSERAKEDVSVLASKMLDETNQARLAIGKGNLEVALADVKRAQSYLDQVETKAPGRTMIPVYKEFVSISFLTPIRAEQNARKHAAGNKQASNNAIVHQVAGDYTSVTVNTTVAKNNLALAKKALGDGNLKAADEALSDVQEGVDIEEVESDTPLQRARENLILARTDAGKGDYAGAHAALTAASRALAQYAAENGPHANAATHLQEEIDSYNRNLAQNHLDLTGKIDGWWNTTSGWTQYRNQEVASKLQK